MELHSMELHSVELYLINCSLSTRIKLKRNLIFFKIPMKINKNATNAYACYEKYDKKYYVYCSRIACFCI